MKKMMYASERWTMTLVAKSSSCNHKIITKTLCSFRCCGHLMRTSESKYMGSKCDAAISCKALTDLLLLHHDDTFRYKFHCLDPSYKRSRRPSAASPIDASLSVHVTSEWVDHTPIKCFLIFSAILRATSCGMPEDHVAYRVGGATSKFYFSRLIIRCI